MTHSSRISTLLLVGLGLGVALTSGAQAQDDARAGLERYIQGWEARCAPLNDESARQAEISYYPEHKRKLAAVVLDIRIEAQCGCMLRELRSIDDERLAAMQAQGLSQSLQAAVEPIVMNCVAQGFKNQWTPYCGALMALETDEPDKIDAACRCTGKTVKTAGNEALIEFSTRTYEDYKRRAGGERPEETEKNMLAAALDACAQAAGIDPQNAYKQSLIRREQETARAVAARNFMSAIAAALDRYYLDNYAYPTQAQGLEALVSKPTIPPLPKHYQGPYMQKLHKDPWGNAFAYRVPGHKHKFDLISYGSDGKPGGEGAAADIRYRDEP